MKTIISIIIILSAFFASYCYIDNWKANSTEVKEIRQRLDYKITADQLKTIQERLWKLEDRYGKKTVMPESVKEEYRELDKSKEELSDKLKRMEKK